VALTLTGIVVLVFARQTVFVAGLLAFFFVAVPATVLNTSISPLMLSATPREYLGRMLAVFNPINTAASMLSVVVAGWLASTALLHFHADVSGLHLGRIDTIFTLSGLLIVAGGLYASIALPPDPSVVAPEPSDGHGGTVVGEVAEIGAPGVIPTQGVTEPLVDPAGS
jgi:uncharacterized membrane protein